jgi:hypothetical protein
MLKRYSGWVWELPVALSAVLVNWFKVGGTFILVTMILLCLWILTLRGQLTNLVTSPFGLMLFPMPKFLALLSNKGFNCFKTSVLDFPYKPFLGFFFSPVGAAAFVAVGVVVSCFFG